VSLPPESIEVGKCYLTSKGQVRRVVICEHGRVTFHTGGRRLYVPGGAPRRRVITLPKFALDAEREVPCDRKDKGMR
jgi:hypothetical protein